MTQMTPGSLYKEIPVTTVIAVTNRRKGVNKCAAKTTESMSLSEYLRRLGLGKEVKAAITERDYRLFRILNGLKAELPQLQKEEILSRLEAILNELK